jgi:pentatricopeptide repeat protein
MIKALVKTGDVERALSLLDEMEQMGVEPTIVTYNTVLLAAAEAPLW